MSISKEPRVVRTEEKKLAGRRLEMSFSHNRTFELWTTFMPKRRHFTNAVNEYLYSLQIYPDTNFFRQFDPKRTFVKWALLEVADYISLPDGMEPFLLPGGEYAVFDFKGSSAQAQNAFQYIYGEWLPASGYELDDRPHFELLGSKYRREDPQSEEEIWIPVRLPGVFQ
ncbi:AraC family transcriptional regulator [Flaviaesturariibacter flavus]|uniref:AraC family transcriptional regulator n=1 Tax=Flaviaesturariibacter flavus TaxID=2502780 RepID=A0A4R1B6G1_9BACT|nr:GyrI-like domain-containing protein [Flaviaesturariibacter flavus]TCJ13270.1 AraC family transcriptional regulator [Flaviaesturariibacter flavus]